MERAAKDSTTGIDQAPGRPKHQLVIVLAVFILALLIRVVLLPRDLPYYTIDENDVVEPALAYMLGDMEPRWYQYGPVTSYLLSLVYFIWKLVSWIFLGWSEDAFYYNAFFRPDSFYIIARVFHFLIPISMGLILWRFLGKYFNRTIAVTGAILCFAPLLDLNTEFTLRIDSFQGLMSLLCLVFSVNIACRERKPFNYIMAGVFAGLSIATKPLTGFLILPVMALGHFYAVAGDDSLVSLGSKAKRYFSDPLIWLLMLGMIASHTLSHPYSVIEFSSFFQEQYQILFERTSEFGKMTGYDFRWVVDRWGLFFALTAGASIVWSVGLRSVPARMVTLYVYIFIGIFLFFSVRNYWYNVIFPMVVALTACFIDHVSNTRRVRKLVKAETASLVITLFLVAIPFYNASSQAIAAWHPAPSLTLRADRAAQLWIEENIPAHSRILLVGWYPINLPRLHADTAARQALWGEYFMYKRGGNVPWVQKFAMAYQEIGREKRPAYALANIRTNYTVDPLDSRGANNLMMNLDRKASANNFDYVVTASPDGYEGPWEKNPGVELLAVFNRKSGHTNDEVKIFRIYKL